MKITEKQLKKSIQSEIKRVISEMKYNRMYDIIKKCVNEAIEDDPRFSVYRTDDGDRWGDANDNLKRTDNEESWADLEDMDNSYQNELGHTADDIYNGQYGLDSGDYFTDSDYAFSHNYWEDGEPEDDMSLAGIQRSKVNDVYNTVESVVRESINKLNKKVNETVDSGASDTHFAILKPINKIIFSWDYSGYDNSELREFKKDYFMDDIVYIGFNPKEVKILTKAACLRQGINPEDESCWDNAFEYKK